MFHTARFRGLAQDERSSVNRVWGLVGRDLRDSLNKLSSSTKEPPEPSAANSRIRSDRVHVMAVP